MMMRTMRLQLRTTPDLRRVTVSLQPFLLRLRSTFGLFREEHIRASETVSQRLALAFQRNKPHDPRNSAVPDFLQEFEDVFAKESFDELPMPRPWDHAIELLDGAEPTSTKCYPLSPAEQKPAGRISGRKTSGLVGSAPASRRHGPPQCSLSRRRTDRSAWSRTTGSSTT